MLVSSAASAADGADELIKNATAANPDLKSITEAIAKVKGCTPKMGPIKKKDRIVEKVTADYEGDYSKVWDACRSTIICDKNAGVQATAAVVGSVGNMFHTDSGGAVVTVTRVKDRWTSPDITHYRDYLLNVQMKNKVICEIQVSSGPMYKAKQGEGHKFYKVMRTVGNTPDDDDNATELVERYMVLLDKSQALYDAAFAKGQ